MPEGRCHGKSVRKLVRCVPTLPALHLSRQSLESSIRCPWRWSGSHGSRIFSSRPIFAFGISGGCDRGGIRQKNGISDFSNHQDPYISCLVNCIMYNDIHNICIYNISILLRLFCRTEDTGSDLCSLLSPAFPSLLGCGGGIKVMIENVFDDEQSIPNSGQLG
jgi:hypothetical protein